MFTSLFRAVLGASLAVVSHGATAQSYPEKPITLIVPFAPGASADLIARAVGRELSSSLGQPVVVENKPGAGGSLGLMALSKMPADGYAIGLGATGAIAVSPHLPDAPPLKPERDLAPVAKLADIPLVLVSNVSNGYPNLQALLKAARSSPGTVSFGHAGQYTSQHLAGQLLANMAQVQLLAVPYKGSGPAVTDLLGGYIPAAVVDLTSAYPHIRAGKLTALGVTSASRSKVAPDIPTIDEAGIKGYSASGWMGLFVPAKTPVAIRDKLSYAVSEAIANPSLQSQFVKIAVEPAFADAKSFQSFITQESDKWAQVIKEMPPSEK
ncbi:Bug family tripartite tricarboxylate transporter substrate binding protein [Advenella mimigardefordensis]|uniref:Putative Bug-like extracytoplasmic solute binding receptor, TTT family n=1 Tax=Advenella mimigardefordensis (strain DSM 17166 / LMG 22922 / DPN7) TaxID=1247726 RepID=W0PEZ3_ADVMD|nr:tripartite tricarboxylate transporter substrate binding protein [Advenella mimigardefordensis]AHG63845.1 putative Bug-like extracytoplasmic solute binding receptor, TTT family [Advenella mimigardefordensis DPN7]